MMLVFALRPDAAAAAYAPAGSAPARPRLARVDAQGRPFLRTATVTMEQPLSYEDYMKERTSRAANGATPAVAPPQTSGSSTGSLSEDEQRQLLSFYESMETPRDATAAANGEANGAQKKPLRATLKEVANAGLSFYESMAAPRDATAAANGEANGAQKKPLSATLKEVAAAGLSFIKDDVLASSSGGADAVIEPPPTASDADSDYERVPWWRQTSTYSETQRSDRRTVFMHDDWVRHRSSERFIRNMRSIGSSGINQALSKELAFVTLAATFVVVMNMLLVSYQDFGGTMHVGLLNAFDNDIRALRLPALPFTISLPALSLLLVFRTNTGYSRWNEARTLWGGLINNCRNVVRQTNTFFPNDPHHNQLKRRMAAETAAFIKALRNFLRGPADDETFRGELYELVGAGLMTPEQAEATMAAKNRPMFCLSAMSATLRKADLPPISAARIDSTISVLVDLTGANERIFKSPIPLVYTRLTSRFLTTFLTLLPLALWAQLGESWNHWATIPAEFMISFFLFGIEEVGIQIEEPFSILPLESFCDGAIAATSEEMLRAEQSGVFEELA